MTYSMKPVYQKLSKIGLKKGMVKTYLPDWWDDSIATTEVGFQESLWLIANTFHIDFKTLNLSISGDSNPQYRLPNHKFKHSVNLDQDKLKPAVAVAMLAAKITLNTFEKPLADLSSLSAESIRERLLSDGNQWIDFKVLVQYCWNIGIPVIFIKEIPIFESVINLQKILEINKDKFLAFCGLGNPNKFYKTLEQNGFNLIQKKSFPDHYQYNDSDINNLRQEAKKYKLKLITTEKDYVKINEHNNTLINVASINLTIEDKQLVKFKALIKESIDG